MTTVEFLHTRQEVTYVMPNDTPSGGEVDIWVCGGGVWDGSVAFTMYGFFCPNICLAAGDVLTITVGGAAQETVGGWPDGGNGGGGVAPPFGIVGFGGGGSTRIQLNGEDWLVAGGHGGPASGNVFTHNSYTTASIDKCLFPDTGFEPLTIEPESRPDYLIGGSTLAVTGWTSGNQATGSNGAPGFTSGTAGSGGGGGGRNGGSSGGVGTLEYLASPPTDLGMAGVPGAHYVPELNFYWWSNSTLYAAPTASVYSGDPGYTYIENSALGSGPHGYVRLDHEGSAGSGSGTFSVGRIRTG